LMKQRYSDLIADAGLSHSPAEPSYAAGTTGVEE